MKQKLTLSIDERILESAKSSAEELGASLSALVEDFFRDGVSRNKSRTALSKWIGAFRLRSDSAPKTKYLSKKYL